MAGAAEALHAGVEADVGLRHYWRVGRHVEVAALIDPRMLVEVEAVAYRPGVGG
jgi:hypothetical protein